MADGADLLRRLQQQMDEESDSGWLDTRTSYDYLYEAALEFTDRTGCLKSSQAITTVADQTDYNLNPDFLRLYAKNDDDELIIKYNDGSDDSFLTFEAYEDIFYGNNTTSVTIPSNFTIIDTDLPSQVTGTATSDGAATRGHCILVDTAGDFSDVEAGDDVHNTTDDSSGVVISKTDSTHLVTVLFGGTGNDWTSSDSYVIQPGARYKLVLDPPPSTDGHTITVPYVQKPAPVYSDYDIYRFPSQYTPALVKYAFWLYKYRNREPNLADNLYKYWLMQIGRYAASVNSALRPNRIKVNFGG